MVDMFQLHPLPPALWACVTVVALACASCASSRSSCPEIAAPCPTCPKTEAAPPASPGTVGVKFIDPKKGRGLFALRKMAEEETIEECEVIELDEDDISSLSQSKLQYYYFLLNDDEDVYGLALGHCSLANHSKQPNSLARAIQRDGRWFIVLEAKRPHPGWRRGHVRLRARLRVQFLSSSVVAAS